MTELFRVDSHEFDGGRVVALEGELDVSTCTGLADQLAGPPGSLIVVDLSGVTFLDSSGLGTIHIARRKAREEGGDLVVCGPTSIVQRVFELTGLDTWITEWDPAWAGESERGLTPNGDSLPTRS